MNLDECPFGNTEKGYEIPEKFSNSVINKTDSNEVCKVMLKKFNYEDICGQLNPDARRGCCLACRNETAP